MNNMSGGGFGNKPRALMCYICGREYGTASLQIHIKTCMKKWEIEESKKPKNQRRPLPQPPKELGGLMGRLNDGEKVGMQDLDSYNSLANDKWNEEALTRCEYCNRTFLPDRMPVHRKVCTAEKPFKPLPGGQNQTSQNFHPEQTSSPSIKNKKGNSTQLNTAKQVLTSTSSQSGSGGLTKNGAGGMSKSMAPSSFKSEYEDPYGGGGNSYKSSPPKKPKSVMCYICGREFGTASIHIHLKSCQKKWEQEEGKKPRNQRRPMPQPPRDWEELVVRLQNGEDVDLTQLDHVNNQANDKWNDEALIRCEFCGRTFLPERMDVHRKVCNAEKPFKPLPNAKGGVSGGGSATSSQMSDYDTYSQMSKGSTMSTSGKQSVKSGGFQSNQSSVSKSVSMNKGSFAGSTSSGGGGGGMGGNKSSMSSTYSAPKKPKSVMCYICGREFGTASINIHIKSCQKKWEIEESKKPRNERRPMPQPPRDWEDLVLRMQNGEDVNIQQLDNINNQANDKWNDEALIRCEYCNRTFLPDRMPVHRKICTAEKPMKSVPNTGGGGGGAGTSGIKQVQTQAYSSTQKGSKQQMSQPKYDDIDDDDDGNFGYNPEGRNVPMKSNVKSSMISGGGAGAKKPTGSFGGGAKSFQSQPMGGGNSMAGVSEYDNVDLVPCGVCGRKFAADRISKHEGACMKAKKGEQKHNKKVAQAEKKAKELDKFVQKEKKFKKADWKKQHEDFQNMLKYNRKVQQIENAGGDIRMAGPAPVQQSNDDLEPCPYCGRKFASARIDKHLGICKNVVNKPKAPPAKNSYSSGGYGGPGPSSSKGYGGGVSSSKGYGGGVSSSKGFGGPSSYGGGGFGTGAKKSTGYGGVKKNSYY